MSTKSEKLSSKKKPTKDSSYEVSVDISTASRGDMPRQYREHAGPTAYRDTVKEMTSGVSGGHGSISPTEKANREKISKKFK